ncbi:zinc-dependent alcohol dehydrogenase [Microbacterium sp. RD1]|uniref:zinc-dependent alcohol dehydrogenase n=1 Tax=Microbacterium sp. RD1 TaxID=3457313 RepID=UPI003FA5BD62
MSAAITAAVYHGIRDVRVEEHPMPRVRPGELLLKVGTVGVCGSDSNEWAYGPHQYPFEVPHPATGHVGPIVPGHEFSGTVVEIGDGVDSAWLGRRVASCGSVACGECAACLRGETNMCARYAGVGLHRDGALAHYVTTPVESCVSIDGRGISLDEAALCQPMAIAVHCVARAGDVAGQTVLVQGVGGIGAFLTYALASAGADVVAADVDEERLDIAAELGAARTVRVAGSPEDGARILEATHGSEIRVIFEVSGSAGGMKTALQIAPKGARIVVVGMQKGPIDIDLRPVTLYERSLIGTNAQIRERDFPRAVDLIASRPGGWSRIAPRVIPLQDIVGSALQPMSEGRAPAIKMLIDPWAEKARPTRVGESP